MRPLLLMGFACAVAITQTATASDFPLDPNTTAIGALAIYIAREEDTLADIARRYDLAYTQLRAANPGVNPWLPGGKRLLLPNRYLLPDAPRRGVVINLAEERLFYYLPNGRNLATFPIGIGVELLRTPLGATRVVAKQARPIWYPPLSIRAERPDLPRAVPPGPENPLGEFALYLGWSGYLIHGTNKPDSVGRMASHGCIHLYPEDIARLYEAVTPDTPVTVLDQPVKVAWVSDALFVEVHPSAAQAAAIEVGDAPGVETPLDLAQRVAAAAADREVAIDWPAVERAGLERRGVPVQVSLRRPEMSAATERGR